MEVAHIEDDAAHDDIVTVHKSVHPPGQLDYLTVQTFTNLLENKLGYRVYCCKLSYGLVGKYQMVNLLALAGSCKLLDGLSAGLSAGSLAGWLTGFF